MTIKKVFNWYLNFRFIAFLVQSALILLSVFYLKISLPIYQLLLVTSLIPATNLIFYFNKNYENLNYKTASLLLIDCLLLTSFLFYSGGYSNPFSTFYILQIILAGILLGSKFSWFIAGISTVSYTVLFYFYYPVHELEHHHHGGINLHLSGMFVSFILLALSVCYFVVKILKQVEQARFELEQSRQKEKNILHLASLNTLLASVAHELNTPLNTIYLIAGDLDQDNQNKDLQLINQQIRLCKEIIDNLRMKSGVLKAENFETILVDILIDEITENFGTRIKIKKEFSSKDTVSLPYQATVKVIQGLIVNALDASDSEKTIEFECALKNEILKIVVRDTGKGMTNEQLNNLGQPFFSTKSSQGLGLGVYLAKSLVSLLNGKINFSSEANKGTEVQIEIPKL